MLNKSVVELVGNTPLLKLNNIIKNYQLNANIYAKLEFLNPTGSIKDRTALYVILDAEKKGLLKENGTVIEATSGNTGIGLASICKSKGYNLILTMPDTMSEERRKLLKGYGATLVLTDGSLGMQGSVDKAIQLHKEIEGSILANQFTNNANVLAHYETTGREIIKDLPNTDIFIASIGTGGTFTGTSKYLKEQNSKIKCIGVEPESSPLLSKGYSGKHNIQGIGANFIPKILDTNYLDEVLTCSDSDSVLFAKEIAKNEGISVGFSSGATLKCAIEVAKRKENKGKNIVIIFADSGDRYLSTEIFS